MKGPKFQTAIIGYLQNHINFVLNVLIGGEFGGVGGVEDTVFSTNAQVELQGSIISDSQKLIMGNQQWALSCLK